MQPKLLPGQGLADQRMTRKGGHRREYRRYRSRCTWASLSQSRTGILFFQSLGCEIPEVIEENLKLCCKTSFQLCGILSKAT